MNLRSLVAAIGPLQASHPPALALVTQYGRDLLMAIEHAGLVEKHLAAAGDRFLDRFVNRVIKGRFASTGVGEQAIALGDRSAGYSKSVSTKRV